MSGFRVTVLYLLLTIPAVLCVANCPADPHAVDPKDDPCNILGYIPSNVLTSVAVVPYGIASLALTYNLIRHGARYMTCLIIGAFAMTSGLAIRYALNKNPDSTGSYIGESLLVILSPTAFIAADYVILGRLTRYLDASKHLIIAPTRIATIFVISDVVMFLIQAGGGGISIHNGTLGFRLTFIGLILQGLSFLAFMIIYVIFIYRIRTRDPQVWLKDSKYKFFNDWRMLSLVLAISCIGITVRTIYRLIEFAQGTGGSLAKNEHTFYLFDSLPLFNAIVIYIPVWPGRYIDDAVLKYGSIPMVQRQGSDSQTD